MDSNSQTLLNDIILKIYTISGLDEMRKTVLSSLRFLIPCVGASSYLASKENPYRLSDGIQVGLNETIIDQYINQFQDLDQTAWEYSTTTSKAYNESVFIQEQAQLQTPFYQAIYAQFEGYYQISLTIMHKGVFLGTISLFRTKKETDFLPEDLFVLELLGTHLGVRFYQSLGGIDVLHVQSPSLDPFNKEFALTVREAEVLNAILNVNDTASICQNLCISPNTFNKHLANIYKKCHVHSRIELLHLIMKQ